MSANDIVPKPFTAKEVAAAQNMTEGQARYVLDGLVERGLAVRDASDKYTINGLGLSVGERMGVVKPIKDWPGQVIDTQALSSDCRSTGENKDADAPPTRTNDL